MPTPVEQIKERLSIVDVVGSYIKLTKAGSSYKALCPFHNEKSPSFNVSPARDAYYCFGCNRGGDIFTFVEEIEGVEFVDALKTLAERAGVELKREESGAKNERERLLAIMDEAGLFYERHLLSNSAVKEYLTKRGLTEETIRGFRIGYAPNEWRLAYEHLRDKGYTDQEIAQAGLIKFPEQEGASNKRPYDRFRGRIMFPIFDPNGRIIAFSGRVFGEQKNQDGTDVAKYVNSPEGPLYDKSSVMFGYDRAKKAIRTQNFAVLVEGQMDLIMSHQAGITNTVAVSGTALTEKHLALLKRLTDNLVFAFDADQAGINATTRAFRLGIGMGMNVRVAAIPQVGGVAKDPADFIKDHPAEWSEVIGKSTHIIDYYLNQLHERGLTKRDHREEVEKNVLPLLLEMPSKIEQAHFIVEVARKLGVPESAVWDDVRRLAGAASLTRVPEVPREKPEQDDAPKTLRQVAEEEIIGILLWQEGYEGNTETPPAFDVKKARIAYHERFLAHGLTPRTPNDDEMKMLVMRAEYKYDHGPELERSVDELLDTLEDEVLREKQAELWKKLSEAEARGDKEAAKEFLQAYQSITPRIIALEDRRLKRGITAT